MVRQQDGWQRRWEVLRVKAPAAGAARIVLATRPAADAGAGDALALWGSPRFQTFRPVGSLVSAIQRARRKGGVRGLLYDARPRSDDDLYSFWVRERAPTRRMLRAERQWAHGRTETFSLITLVSETTGWPSARTIASVGRQTYPRWEWILVARADSAGRAGSAVERLMRDTRVRIISPLVSCTADAWNAALADARGTYAALLDPNDLLAPSALYESARAIERAPGLDLLYSDEDSVAATGTRRSAPRFKPSWSPDLLLAGNYIGRLAVMRVAAAAAAGGFRRGFDDAEEWDLFLRLSRANARIDRVPMCLYHRGAVPESPERGRSEAAALTDHCERLGLPATVSKSGGGYRAAWSIRGRPKVSIVIPNRNAAAVITQCVKGLLRDTAYPHREVVIVDNGSTDPAVLALYRSLEHDGRGFVVPFDRPFNFSAACNAGAAASDGDLLLFLNNDVEVIHPDWLDELVRWAQRPDIGIVGAKLLYPDRTIQHAGVVFGLGLVGHIFARADARSSGLFGSADSCRNYLAVTGACQMMRRDVFERIGRCDEGFYLSFSDIALCMEARKAGFRVVYTPHACLIHHESYTRQRHDRPEDLERLCRYLVDERFDEDPFFHPELNPCSALPALRPPFDPTPRQAVHDYVERVLAAAPVAGR
jgi:GT2 family glycosyltransferase